MLCPKCDTELKKLVYVEHLDESFVKCPNCGYKTWVKGESEPL